VKGVFFITDIIYFILFIFILYVAGVTITFGLLVTDVLGVYDDNEKVIDLKLFFQCSLLFPLLLINTRRKNNG
jgi:hypothetical protein